MWAASCWFLPSDHCLVCLGVVVPDLFSLSSPPAAVSGANLAGFAGVLIGGGTPESAGVLAGEHRTLAGGRYLKRRVYTSSSFSGRQRTLLPPTAIGARIRPPAPRVYPVVAAYESAPKLRWLTKDTRAAARRFAAARTLAAGAWWPW
uniref:Uncharacterized protein n=1 Tax=Arundo donax TaxID=35708 RepID=A0A0A8XQH8_ARUDO